MRVVALVFVFTVFALGSLLILLAGGASAQAAANQSADQAVNESVETVERIDRNTVILESDYSEKSGVATVTLESDRVQRVTLSDAGAFVTGGQVNQKTTVLKPDEPTTVRLDVTEVDGRVGVSISTSKTLYAHIIEVPNYLFYSDPGWGTVRIVGFGSGFGVLFALGAEVARRKWFGRNEVTAIA